MKLRIFLLTVVCALMLAQTGGEIPTFPGDGNPLHDGQPQWCAAHDENGFKANCGKCDRRCDEDSDKRCKTHCRSRTACRCNPECTIKGHR